jgi:hypothetical protein
VRWVLRQARMFCCAYVCRREIPAAGGRAWARQGGRAAGQVRASARAPCDYGCRSRSLPPKAAAVEAMNAPISMDSAVRMDAVAAALRAASAA